jgi:ribosomal protein L37AE/L43A
MIKLINIVREIITNAGTKIKCSNCGWKWNIKDGGKDLFICHKCNHDNQQYPS